MRSRVRLGLACIALLAWSAPTAARAQIVADAQSLNPTWSEIRIPVHSHVGVTAGQTLLLQATLYQTVSAGARPLIILNHGSTGWRTDPAVAKMTFRYQEEARSLLSRGFSVVVPMRKGRGNSEGPMMEPSDTSIPERVQLDSAIEDEDAVIDFIKAEPYVDPARIVVGGVSRGGMLSVIYAGRRADRVAGVINFSGGWWSEGFGGADNIRLSVEAGRTARVPMLWLYGEGDIYYALPDAEQYFEAFRSSGGIGRFVKMRGGHGLFSDIDQWRDVVSDYLMGITKGDH